MLTATDEATEFLTPETLAPEVLAVACPGGMARQLRVQVLDESTPSRWRHMGSFRDAQPAMDLAARLRASGTTARVVQCNRLPTGA